MTSREKRNTEWRRRYEEGESLLDIAPLGVRTETVREGIVEAGGTIRPRTAKGMVGPSAPGKNKTPPMYMKDGVKPVPGAKGQPRGLIMRGSRRAGKRRHSR